MLRVEKIEINNARRLGKKVNIDFGEGATIILAPNGTGKTTVFECIELAVTGAIRRIEKSPCAIVRDGCDKTDVELFFNGEQACKIICNKNGGIEYKGDIRQILQVGQDVSIPYMFRMTHLFEQHNKNWFVECDANEAGELLGKLPVSKDLQIILSKKMALNRAINEMESKIDEELQTKRKNIVEFKGLIEKNAKLKAGTPKNSMSDIILELNLISENNKIKVYDGNGKDVNQVSLYSETLKSELTQEAHKNKALKEDLIILKERMTFFIQNSEELINENKELKTLLQSELIAKKDKEQKEKDANNILENIEELSEEITANERIAIKFSDKKRHTEKLSSAKIKVKESKDNLETVKQIYNEQLEILANNEKLKDEHKIVNESIEKNREQLLFLNKKNEYLNEWKKLFAENENLSKELIEHRKNKENLNKLKELIDNKVASQKENYSSKKKNLNDLNSASEAVQNAVGEIRKHLYKDQTSCPVCQAEYSHEELMMRMEKALNSMNPMISDAIKEERFAYEELQKVLKEQNGSANKLDAANKKIDDIETKIRENDSTINQLRRKFFQGIESIKDAAENLEKEYESNSVILNDLFDKKRSLKEIQPIEPINKLNLSKLENKRNIKEISDIIDNLEKEISFEESKVENLSNELSNIEMNDVTEKLTVNKNTLAEKTSKLEKLKKELSEIKKNIDSLQQLILSKKDSISKINATQTGIINQWNSVGLKGEPNITELEEYNKFLLEETSKLDDDIKKTYNLQEDLAKWRIFEDYKILDSEIIKRTGDFTIEQYLEKISGDMEKYKEEYDKFVNKKKAIDKFLDEISAESGDILSQINSINGPWREMLKRIVVNRQIQSSPLLNNSFSRNRLKANVETYVNETNINMSDFASEGQLADLQLSFMLSIANKYNWTPWKALLLDDPTQHHDLVHASSVFDLLRDYIADLNYQVMLSTHDSVQAKFFQRKLENDGIPSKIYQLVMSNEGVTAERIC